FRGGPSVALAEPGELEVLEDGEIPVVDTGIANEIASGVTESAGDGFDERVGIEVARESAVALGQNGIANEIGTLAFVAGIGAGDIGIEADVDWRAGAPGADADDLPAVESLASEAVRAGEEGQFPDVVDGERIGCVLVGNG